jgi:putrescine importer
MPSVQSAPTGDVPRLHRVLTLWDLVLYGMIVIQPTAPMPVYGVMSQRARGHAVTIVLIAMVAMLFTAISYGRMARAYPSAGSAFTYVGREIHPALGYVTGWGDGDGLYAQPSDLHNSM